ncbi:MAG: hypothetical protein IIV93_04030 [Clostridia bacterium]|nr:hypothetical protein [Clostridia bacterium]
MSKIFKIDRAMVSTAVMTSGLCARDVYPRHSSVLNPSESVSHTRLRFCFGSSRASGAVFLRFVIS